MSEREPGSFDENQLEEALAEELDRVSPRRDLWPAIRNRLQLPLAKPRRRWLAPVLGSAAVLLLIAIITPLALFLPAAPVAAPAAPFAAPATVMATPTPPFAGDNLVSVGSSVFRARGCSACHTIDSVPHARGQVGPNLSGVGTKGADFIRTSICDPDAVLAEGFAPGIMPLNFCDVLTQEEIDAIVTFLLEQQ